MTDERQVENEEEPLDARVEDLARELSRVINAGTLEGRERLREMAIHLLRDEVQVDVPDREGTVPMPGPGPAFNPFAIAIPLCLMGGVLVILFPPAGLLLFAVAAFMMAWGVAASLLSRR